ncbi:MAG: LacI family transcriptional regulator [Spirochaetia bacterium]|nr:LacI family transcriptional regulator [Spirochaetia bacterium]
MTIKDVARLSNVSPATVSRVLNKVPFGMSKETRDKVLQVIEQTGYNPNAVARSMVTKKNTSIGLIVPDITNPFYALMAKGIGKAAGEKGYDVILCNSDNDGEDEYRNLRRLKDNYVAGIIYNNYHAGSKTMKLIDSIHVPVIYIDNQRDADNAICIHVKQKQGMKMMTDFLVDNGHRKFAYLAGPESVFSASQRLLGFEDSLASHHIPLIPELVLHCDYTMEGGRVATRKILDGNNSQITCIICANDLIALGTIQILQEAGLSIPKDISVTGFDNIPFSRLVTPGLTTIDNPVEAMGNFAAGTIIRLIEGEQVQQIRDYAFAPTLIERNSVATL